MDSDSGDFVKSLVQKSEGVFLWLCLAIRNINKGYYFEDDFETIQKRIDSLPAELHSLYQDMWQKSCMDNPQECNRLAALYFKLVIFFHKAPHFLFKHSVLELMLAFTSVADTLLGSGKTLPKPPPANDLLKQCEETERKMNVYCAGLFELVPNSSSHHYDVQSWRGGEYEQLVLLVGERWPRSQ